MRVLLAPEAYRPDDLSANGTVGDAVTLLERWLDRDPTLHGYWLLPPCESASYDAADVLADRDRVTLIEAPGFLAGTDREHLFTEGGYSRPQLEAIRAAVYDRGAYLDAVVDGHRSGRPALSRWLLASVDRWAATVEPLDVIAHVHDLQLPFKYRYAEARNEFQARMAVCSAVFADGLWFKAGVDADRLATYAGEFLRESLVDDVLDDAVLTNSPMALDRFDERYADEPRVLHVAGSFWAKKNADVVLSIGERLHAEHGVRTLVTSMEPIPDGVRDRPWLDARGSADRETYEAALRAGDLAVCASAYETLARTPFEQAASGQVLLLCDRPWIDDCVPDDHPLIGDLVELEALATWAVEHWDEAVAANRRLVDHVARVRDPDRAARRTLDDLRRRVDRKTRRFRAADDGVLEPVSRTLSEREIGAPGTSADGGASGVTVDGLARATAAVTGDGEPLTARESVARADLRYALRALGYRDAGNPGTPVFRRGEQDRRARS